MKPNPFHLGPADDLGPKTPEPTREQIFRLAAKHCDQTLCNRARAVQGWNFSKEGLLDFARALRALETAPEDAERARWEEHIRMERKALAHAAGPKTR